LQRSTSAGLFLAYERATGVRATLRKWWDRIRRGPHNDIYGAAPTMIGIGTQRPDVHVPFKFDEKARQKKSSHN
jgi:hypothetical protein